MKIITVALGQSKIKLRQRSLKFRWDLISSSVFSATDLIQDTGCQLIEDIVLDGIVVMPVATVDIRYCCDL